MRQRTAANTSKLRDGPEDTHPTKAVLPVVAAIQFFLFRETRKMGRYIDVRADEVSAIQA